MKGKGLKHRLNGMGPAVGSALLSLMVGALVSSPWSFEASAAEKLTIAGSSTVKPIVEAAAASFKKSHGGLSIVIGGGGSSNGVENAANGKVDIGMASRKLKDKEKNAFPDLVPVPVGQDGVALIVHKSNPVENLTKSQVLELYTGKIGSWSGVGGEDRSVELVGILLHHGTSSVFMKFFGLEAEEQGEGATKTVNYWSKAGGKSMTGSAKGVDGNQPSCAAVITEPGAVSFASIGFAQSLAEKGAPIKLLKLEGVDPTAENVVSGAYALSRPLLVITNGEASGRAKAFIDHLLSAEGQKIVEDKGYIPVQ